MTDGIKKLETFGDYVRNIPQNTLATLFIKYQENSGNTHDIEAFNQIRCYGKIELQNPY